MAIQPTEGRIVPPEASQVISADGSILGRITSSRMSPTLDRAICLGQVEAPVSAPGSELTVRLPDGRNIAARVMEHLAHVDPEGTRQNVDTPVSGLRPHDAPVARSPISQRGDLTSIADWRVSARQSGAGTTLADLTPLAKVGVRGQHDGALGSILGTQYGRSVLGPDRHLVVGSGPGEWLVLGDPGSQDKLLTRLQRAAADVEEFASVIDLTHGRAMVRLTSEHGADLLAKVCAVDLSDDFTPDGAAFRTSVAKLVTDVIRVDRDGIRSYLLHCERSSGQYLFDSLLDAGAEFGIEIDGCPTSPTF